MTRAEKIEEAAEALLEQMRGEPRSLKVHERGCELKAALNLPREPATCAHDLPPSVMELLGYRKTIDSNTGDVRYVPCNDTRARAHAQLDILKRACEHDENCDTQQPSPSLGPSTKPCNCSASRPAAPPSPSDEALLRAYRWIARVHERAPVRDHACAQCVPGGDIVIAGFACVPHQALRALAAKGGE